MFPPFSSFVCASRWSDPRHRSAPLNDYSSFCGPQPHNVGFIHPCAPGLTRGGAASFLLGGCVPGFGRGRVLPPVRQNGRSRSMIGGKSSYEPRPFCPAGGGPQLGGFRNTPVCVIAGQDALELATEGRRKPKPNEAFELNQGGGGATPPPARLDRRAGVTEYDTLQRRAIPNAQERQFVRPVDFAERRNIQEVNLRIGINRPGAAAGLPSVPIIRPHVRQTFMNTRSLTERHAETMEALLDAIAQSVDLNGEVVQLDQYKWTKAARLAAQAYDEAQLMHATRQLMLVMDKEPGPDSPRFQRLLSEYQRFGERTGRARKTA